jgi:PAS domain S-box-containing protein
MPEETILLARRSIVAILALFVAHAMVLFVFGRNGHGPLLSNLIQLAIGVGALSIVVRAASRSDSFARRVWLLVATALIVWNAAQAFITYYENVLRVPYSSPYPSDPLLFFWVMPLFMVLVIDEETASSSIDWIPVMDFAQVVIVAVAIHQSTLAAPVFWQTPSGWLLGRTWDATNMRDALLTALLLLRAMAARHPLVRSIFLRITAFFVCYQVADILYHYGEEYWGFVTGSHWDLLWSLPFLVLAVAAATWNHLDESDLQTSLAHTERVKRILVVSSLVLPIVVLFLGIQIHDERPYVALTLVFTSLACVGARLLLTQFRHERAEKLQSALYRIANAASSAVDLPELYRAIHKILGDLMYAKNCYIALYDADMDFVSFPYFVDEEDQEAPPARKARRGLTEYVLRTGHPLLANPDVLDDLARQGEVTRVGAPSLDWMGVPLRKGDVVFGVLALQSYEPRIRYDERELQILTFVSQQIASVVWQKRVQQAIVESEANFRALAENAAAVIVIYDENRFHYLNPAALKILGYAWDEISRIGPITVVHPDDRRRVMRAMKVADSRSTIATRFEFKVRTKNGAVRILEASGNRITFKGNPAVVGVAVDITERKQFEEQLRQAVKMEAVGRLSGGVAHDFNNLLTVIQLSTQDLKEELAGQERSMGQLELIQDAANRAASLTRQLLAFSRQQLMQSRILNLNTVVTEMEKMLRRVIGEDIDFRTAPAAELGSVRADPSQVEQVILNLVVNARDAMPHGGKLTLETANVNIDEEYARLHVGMRPGRYVMLAVSDTGTGMDRETQAHVFEPFFTTKGIGKGTGLGLSTVYGIVKQSEGYISVYSEVGHGSTFKVYLPSVDAPAAQPVAQPAVKPSQVGTETVLLVEDEPSLRKLVEHNLRALGYNVLAVEHAAEVESFAASVAGPIDLLLTDVVMPEMSGQEVVKRLTKIRPGVKVIYMSGYTPEAVLDGDTKDSTVGFLQKPFTNAELRQKVRAMLDLRATAASTSN